MSRVLAVSLLLPTLLLGGCISLFPKPPPPPRIYALEAGNVERVAGAPADTAIAVAEPGGDRTILGSELMVRNDNVYTVIGQSQWSNRAAESLQTLAAQTIARQGRFRAAVPSLGARTNYEVRWDVLAFEVRETGTAGDPAARWTARFEADVRVVDLRRRVLATEIISREVPIAEHRSGVVAHAMEEAARQVSARIGVLAADAVAADLARLQREEAAQNEPARPSQRGPRRQRRQ